MIDRPILCREQASIGEAARSRILGTAFAQIALTVALVVSTVAILVMAGTTAAMAETRSDLMVMDEGTRFSTAAILTIILIVMGVLTVLALRDVQPSKRSAQVRRPRR